MSKLGRSILVADDDRDTRMLLDRFLKSKGYDMLLAENGADAIDQARRHQPDLIFMDLLMPALDGEDAACRLKQDPTTSQIPIVAISARYGGPVVSPVFARFLPKPFQLRDVLQLVVELVALVGTRRGTWPLNGAPHQGTSDAR